jgi:uncharacterized phiE125 gp8 family phage protein
VALKLIAAPVAEPVTLAEAKAHLRVEGTDDDALITALIVAARQGAEHMTGRAIMPQTLELALDGFYDGMDSGLTWGGRHAYRVTLPRPPLASITSVKYVDADGVLQTMASSDYQLDSHSEPARLVPAYGTCWPTTRCQPNAVLIRYVAGYADANAVPQDIRQWMLLRIGMLYENRESVNVGNIVTEMPYVDCLLDAYRVWSL